MEHLSVLKLPRCTRIGLRCEEEIRVDRRLLVLHYVLAFRSFNMETGGIIAASTSSCV